jgi:hypothetical protein
MSQAERALLLGDARNIAQLGLPACPAVAFLSLKMFYFKSAKGIQIKTKEEEKEQSEGSAACNFAKNAIFLCLTI